LIRKNNMAKHCLKCGIKNNDYEENFQKLENLIGKQDWFCDKCFPISKKHKTEYVVMPIAKPINSIHKLLDITIASLNKIFKRQNGQINQMVWAKQVKQVVSFDDIILIQKNSEFKKVLKQQMDEKININTNNTNNNNLKL